MGRGVITAMSSLHYPSPQPSLATGESVTGVALRPGRDADADGFVALIGACWDQYPGIVLDVDAEMPELRALASYYANKGGALWVAEADSRVVGMVATVPHDAGIWEICRVYTLPALHGGGLGHRLLDAAEVHARTAGATRFVRWSDTRFDRAHRFYEKRSYIRQGPIRYCTISRIRWSSATSNR